MRRDRRGRMASGDSVSSPGLFGTNRKAVGARIWIDALNGIRIYESDVSRHLKRGSRRLLDAGEAIMHAG